MTGLAVAVLASPWGAVVLAVLGLLAVTAGAALGAVWDRAMAAAGRRIDRTRRAYAAYHQPPTGVHRCTP